jgi:hypothetical protein
MVLNYEYSLEMETDMQALILRIIFFMQLSIIKFILKTSITVYSKKRMICVNFDCFH